MSASNPNDAEDLFGRYLNHCDSEVDLRELGGLLAADAELADNLTRACCLEVMVELHFAQQQVEIGLPGTRQPAKSSFVRAGPVAIAVSAVAAFVLLGVFFWSGLVQLEPPFAIEVLSGLIDVDCVATSAVPFDASFEVRGSSTAAISLLGGGDALLEAATTAIVQSHGTSPLLRLTSGGGRFRVTTDAPIKIQTPAGTILGRNNQFDVDLQEAFVSGEPTMQSQALLLLTFAVLTGQVEVQDETQKVPVAAGQQRVFSPQKDPMFAGQVIEVSTDATQLTIEGARPKPNANPPRRTVQISAATVQAYYGVRRGGDKPTAGYHAVTTLDVNALFLLQEAGVGILERCDVSRFDAINDSEQSYAACILSKCAIISPILLAMHRCCAGDCGVMRTDGSAGLGAR